MGDAAGELDDFLAAGDFTQRVGDDFAVFAGDDLGQFALAVVEQFAEPEQHLGALGQAGVAPGGERRSRGVDHRPGVLHRRQRDLTRHLTRRRIRHRRGRTGRTLEHLTVDPMRNLRSHTRKSLAREPAGVDTHCQRIAPQEYTVSMPLTVGEVIALPAVQQGDPEVLSDRRWTETIRWVHGSDLADLSSLLQGGELVLTTGKALARHPRKYLRGLADAGALGVIVEVGTQVPALPAGVGAIAEELTLALVVLHRTVRFVEITEAVHRRIVAEQYDEVAFDRRVHETFTELSMKRASLSGIVDAAAHILAEPVVLEDLSHQAIAMSAGIPADLLDNWERRSRRSPGRTDHAEPWAVTGVGPRAQQWGRLVVPKRTATSTAPRWCSSGRRPRWPCTG